MSKSYFECSLPELQAEVAAIGRETETLFGPLTGAQLNWKPGAEIWSVAQCLEHVLIVNRAMLKPLHAIAQGRKQPKLLERVPLLPKLVAWMMAKSMSPQSTQKFKAPVAMTPSASTLDAQIVKEYGAHQRELMSCFQALDKSDLVSVVMVSPLMNLMTYSVLDACRIIVAHERRHMAQAQRIIQTVGFPQ